MWTPDRLGWLALAWFDQFGARTLRKLRSYYHNGSEALTAPLELMLSLGITRQAAEKFASWRNNIDPEAFARRCDSEGIRFVTDRDPEFPNGFKLSADPPAVLFIRGTILNPVNPISVVGTRSMTFYGARATELICRGLVKVGCQIVSGLALGIDGKAHETALDFGGKTIAILPGGCNDEAIYPRNNYPLARRILEQGGTILSEMPPGTESLRFLFPLRNRLIASLSRVTVVVEAGESSGSLITAKLALEENRDVFAVPGPITNERSSGPNGLLKMGAIPCTSAEDILNHLELKPGGFDRVPCQDPASPEDEEMLRLLDRPLHIDEIVRAAEKRAGDVSSHLSMLEIKGWAEHRGAGIYARTPLGKKLID